MADRRTAPEPVACSRENTDLFIIPEKVEIQRLPVSEVPIRNVVPHPGVS